jgi:hypothetical protein
MNIVVFRCDTVDRVRAAIAEAHARFEGAPITVVCQSRDAHFFEDLDASISTFDGTRLDGADAAHVPDALHQLVAKDDAIAIIPVRSNDPKSAAVGYANVVGVCRRSGIRELVFRTMDGVWYERSVSWASLARIADAISVLAIPFSVVRAFFRIAANLDRHVLALTPEPVDWLCHVTKVRWARRVGWFGVAPNCYLGNPFSLVYPPLSLMILGILGVSGTSLLMGLGQWLGLFALAYSARSMPAALVAAFLLGSPLYKYSWIRVGRIELLGWAFATAGWCGVWTGHSLIAGFFLGLAALSHPFSGAFGALLAVALAFVRNQAPASMSLTMGTVAFAMAGFWWIPFLRHGRRKLGFRKLRDSVRVLGVDVGEVKTKAFALGALTIIALLRGLPLPLTLTLGLLLALHGVLLKTRSYLFHPFSLDLTVLMASFVAVLATDSWGVGAAALLLLFSSPSVGSRSAVDITPTTFEPTLNALEQLGRALPDHARVAFEFSKTWTADTFWSWLRATAWADLHVEDIAGVSSDQVEFELPFEYEQNINLDDRVSKLRERLERVGATHIATYSATFADALRALGAAEVVSTLVPAPTSLQDRTYTIFASPWTTSRLEGPGELVVFRNELRLRASTPGRYTVKYALYGGWAATNQFGANLPLVDAKPGMTVDVDEPGWIRFQYSWLNYFRL